ncbi:hypothetical protein CBM2598_U30112 [Cupriavidus taiwanensis]|uniref:Uncharacterized protein n=1 Tax=Cupriavidus taiwanensis TaxID=164546 RepID=A0A7Z7JID0_9BURK|nr:hypothetical protein CBM2598_U30112 [Cupriavidus taiwanensis]SPC25875.1 hypothetical protein CBM2594_U20062 [Cupriavidus taiwanensis]
MDGCDVLRVPKVPVSGTCYLDLGNTLTWGTSSAIDGLQFGRLIWHLLGLDRFSFDQLGLSGTST